MKFSSKLIIIFPIIISLHLLCMPQMSATNECCETMSCKSSLYDDSTYNISIESPFRMKGYNLESCGCPGFGLYCDDKQGLLLELPNAGNLTVGSVYYSLRQISVSDPNDCLPQKLLSLDLTETPFEGLGYNVEFWVYNCSGLSDGDFDSFLYDEIDCMKGLTSNYTIVSVSAGTTVTNPNCSLVKDVVFQTEYPFSYLSSYSRLYLTWDEHDDCESCDSSTPNESFTRDNSTSNSALGMLALPAMVFMIIIVVVSYRLYTARSSRRNDEQPAVVTTTNHVISHTQTTQPSSSAHGLDQNTINSYPMVVIGNSGRLIKPDDDKCSICLSDYVPGDTLKILPECVHRFHADCIDLWLSAKSTCPICRTSPPHNSQV